MSPVVTTPVLVTSGCYEFRTLSFEADDDISSDTVQFAVTPHTLPRTYPATSDWTAVADPDVAPPSGNVNIAEVSVFVNNRYPGPASYDGWLKVGDNPETPARYCGTFNTA